MGHCKFDEELAERFLAPFIREWNAMNLADLPYPRVWHCSRDPNVRIRLTLAKSEPLGLNYAEFELAEAASFRLRCWIEGPLGDLSFQSHHPSLWADGDVEAAREWIDRRCVEDS
jgi:hypothetical protein